MSFDPTKPCAMRDGTPVEIVSTAGPTVVSGVAYPIIAKFVNRDGIETQQCYRVDGRIGASESPFDLVNPPQRVDYWIAFRPGHPMDVLEGASEHDARVAAAGANGLVHLVFADGDFLSAEYLR